MQEAEEARRQAGAPDHPVRRRNPSLQQGAAGRLPAARRGGRPRADRRDDRESVVRGERGAAVAVEGVRPEAARSGGADGHPARAPGATASAGSDARRVDRAGRADGGRALRQRRRARRARHARTDRRLRDAPQAAPSSISRPSPSCWSGARCSTTRRARSTTTSSRRCTNRCATAIPTRRSTGSRGCSKPAKTRCMSRGAWSASPRRTSASPIRRRWW